MELINFSRRHKRNRYETPSVVAGDFNITEKPGILHIIWFSVLFDRKLTFKWHAESQCSKAVKVCNALSCMGNTSRGISSNILCRDAVAYVLLIAYYAAETWWPGRKRAGLLRTISNRADTILNRSEKIYPSCLPGHPLSVLHHKNSSSTKRVRITSHRNHT